MAAKILRGVREIGVQIVLQAALLAAAIVLAAVVIKTVTG